LEVLIDQIISKSDRKKENMKYNSVHEFDLEM